MKARTKMSYPLLAVSILLLVVAAYIIGNLSKDAFVDPTVSEQPTTAYWPVQSIDTMKYSRDAARAAVDNPEFDILIENQVSEIAKTGATHVAIGTPYEAEFIPFMRKWVVAARKNNLKVWFRGNMAGWEEWFEYPRIDRATHTQGVKDFILENPDLFENGDIFVSCPECENGGPGDPRMTGDTEGYRRFIIDEYNIVKQAFKDINKNVIANYYSTNGDVARLIMDRETTAALDGVIAIDHYVESPQKFVDDIDAYAQQSGGRVVIGEWGAPIPDIHGEMSPAEQADYIRETFDLLKDNPHIEAINYWVSRGGSTELWSEDTTRKPGVAALAEYFKPRMITGKIVDTAGNPLEKTVVMTQNRRIETTDDGTFAIPVIDETEISVMKDDYEQTVIALNETENTLGEIKLKPIKESWFDGVRMFFRSLLP